MNAPLACNMLGIKPEAEDKTKVEEPTKDPGKVILLLLKISYFAMALCTHLADFYSRRRMVLGYYLSTVS
jgi:hypothetical protein